MWSSYINVRVPLVDKTIIALDWLLHNHLVNLSIYRCSGENSDVIVQLISVKQSIKDVPNLGVLYDNNISIIHVFY